jgi:hypothetical protein
MTRPITRHIPPEEIMSKLRSLLEYNRVFASKALARAGDRARRRTAKQSHPLRPAETAN